MGSIGSKGAQTSTGSSPPPTSGVNGSDAANSSAAQHGNDAFYTDLAALGSITETELREVEREAEKRLRPFACGVGDCQRRYKNMNGLRYHYQVRFPNFSKSKRSNKCDLPSSIRETTVQWGWPCSQGVYTNV